MLAVGWQPSVIRAGVAGALASLAWLVARPRDRWHFLALGALVLLAWSPTSVLEPGFQLSFAAVAAIFVGVPRVRDRLDGYPTPARLADGLGRRRQSAGSSRLRSSFSTSVRRRSTRSLPNVLAEPAVPLVLGLGLLAGVVDPVAPGAATALAWLAGWAAAWIELVARLVASLPSAQIGASTALALALGRSAIWLRCELLLSGVSGAPPGCRNGFRRRGGRRRDRRLVGSPARADLGSNPPGSG